MATIISTQQRATPLVLDSAPESTGNFFSAIADVVAELGYCLKLSAQSLSYSFSSSAPTYPESSATRMDSWPIDLWVF
jgi:hypothetical protein